MAIRSVLPAGLCYKIPQIKEYINLSASIPTIRLAAISASHLYWSSAFDTAARVRRPFEFSFEISGPRVFPLCEIKYIILYTMLILS